MILPDLILATKLINGTRNNFYYIIST